MKKKNRRRLTALVISSLAVIHAQSAFAESLNVKIRQIDRIGELKSATCKQLQKCDLPLDIQTSHAKETVTVHADYIKAGGVRLTFETSKGFLYARDKNPTEMRVFYETIWHTDVSKEKAQTVALFFPVVPNPITAPFLTTAKESVAELEITTEVTP